jgi:hypothetical protein
MVEHVADIDLNKVGERRPGMERNGGTRDTLVSYIRYGPRSESYFDWPSSIAKVGKECDSCLSLRL